MNEILMRNEMDDTRLEYVAGGSTGSDDVYVHRGCGGRISYYPYWWSKCSKCNEEHWSLSAFEYFTISEYDYLKYFGND